MKKRSKSPNNMKLGNLLIIKNGVGTITDLKYAVFKVQKNIFSRPKYIAYPGEFEVYLGDRIITSESENVPHLINSIDVDKEITSKEVVNILVKNNDIKVLKKYIKDYRKLND